MLVNLDVYHMIYIILGASPDGINIDEKMKDIADYWKLRILKAEYPWKAKKNIGFKCNYKWKFGIWMNVIF